MALWERHLVCWGIPGWEKRVGREEADGEIDTHTRKGLVIAYGS